MRIDSSGNLVMATGKQIRNTQYQDLEIGAMNGDGSDTIIKSAGSEIHQAYIGSWTETMRIDDNHRIARPHNEGGFAHAMERVCQSPAVKGTKYEKELRAKHIP